MSNTDKPTTKKVLVSLTPEQTKVLEERANRECRSLANMVQYLLMQQFASSDEPVEQIN